MLEPQRSREPDRRLPPPDEVHVDAPGAGHQADQQPDRAGSQDEQASARPDPAASTARHALPPGSTSAPIVSSIASGSARSEDTGMTTCWQGHRTTRCEPPTSNRSSHRCWRPLTHLAHRPQPSIVSPVTRRPRHASSTSGPTLRTVPHHSCPIRSG